MEKKTILHSVDHNKRCNADRIHFTWSRGEHIVCRKFQTRHQRAAGRTCTYETYDFVVKTSVVPVHKETLNVLLSAKLDVGRVIARLNESVCLVAHRKSEQSYRVGAVHRHRKSCTIACHNNSSGQLEETAGVAERWSMVLATSNAEHFHSFVRSIISLLRRPSPRGLTAQPNSTYSSLDERRYDKTKGPRRAPHRLAQLEAVGP